MFACSFKQAVNTMRLQIAIHLNTEQQAAVVAVFCDFHGWHGADFPGEVALSHSTSKKNDRRLALNRSRYKMEQKIHSVSTKSLLTISPNFVTFNFVIDCLRRHLDPGSPAILYSLFKGKSGAAGSYCLADGAESRGLRHGGNSMAHSAEIQK